MRGRTWRDVRIPEHPGRAKPWFVTLVRRVLRPLVAFGHRARLEGVEHLPRSGPFMLVANHSAVLALAEIGSFIALYLEQVGPDRPLAGFAHPLGLRLFPASVVLDAVGAIPSTYEAAEQTLARGVPLLVFPGGDHESMRPIWQAHTVDLGGRVGFLRIAKKLGVPIVPMGIRGSHFTAPVLWRSRVLPRLLVTPHLVGLKRWPLTLFGVLGALAIGLGLEVSLAVRALIVWLWLGSPFIAMSFVPWPIRMRIGPPIAPASLFDEGEGDEALRGALAKVEAELQRLVDG